MYEFNKTVALKRVANIFKNGACVNLGIGIPAQVCNYISKDKGIILQAENGILGMGGDPKNIEADLQNAGGMPASIVKGACFFDSELSFTIIRGGHIDYTVLGYLEVDQYANIANYMIPGKMVVGMGGAMDLVRGVKEVIVIGTHLDKKGKPKLLKKCNLPLTGAGVVSAVVTDAAFFSFKNNKFFLKEVFKPFSLDWVLKNTAGEIEVSKELKIIKI